MIKVKICGLRNVDDVKLVNEFLPDYVGFVLAESKRKVSVESLQKLIANLDTRISAVGVFVDADIQLIEKTLKHGLRVIQLHGNEDPIYLRQLLLLKNNYDFEIWKAIRIDHQTEKEVLEEIESYEITDRFLLDKKSDTSYGGTGESFQWANYKNISHKHSIILAGGLNPENVRKGIDTVKPYCIDVSSGVETDNKKDRRKIEDFLQIIT
ncbi:MAG: N-(5'-phosphoribosyl)anthranilate isomerase [Clostridiales bacterium 38_11]|nr:MAG: N-(5'-phosphoribosyl)anthranilate isomerase [Clostridiales bacterium 38_11]HBH11622.1 N-(5'-phosphoribosyl)anthranilate isomerase [Clostridiales bacterium]